MTSTGERPARREPGRQDWSTWPHYDAATAGYRGWWYPVRWSSEIGEKPVAVKLCGDRIALVRDAGSVYALHDRCPHRGVPLSLGDKQFLGTLSCPYHGWTFDLPTGRLAAVITDGPQSPICGKVAVRTYPVAERLGMVWVYIPRDNEPAPPIDAQLPEELVGTSYALGGRMQPRKGNWRFAAENGYDEGHAKYLHRTSLWRLFKSMPVWNETHITRRGRWIYRVQDAQHWDAEFPGLGRWSSRRWWHVNRPPRSGAPAASNVGNTGGRARVNRVIRGQEFPGFASIAMPGVLRIVYPNFIHYEFYVPVDADHHRYVGLMVNFGGAVTAVRFWLKYLGAIRWLFHGNFSAQDAWMVDVTDAPPERLYRPDVSLTEWRKLCEDVVAGKVEGQGQPVGRVGRSRPWGRFRRTQVHRIQA